VYSAQHKDKSPRGVWVASLLEEGLRPRMVVVAAVRDKAAWYAEWVLIWGLSRMGYDLLNIAHNPKRKNSLYRSRRYQKSVHLADLLFH
jgi:hypothetical protein